GRINALYVDRAARLWVATSRGVSRIDDPSAEHPTFVNYSTAQGLSGNVTFAITEDLYGRIYIGTGQGLDRLDTTTARVKHYTTADGLAGGKIAAAFCARDGWLWIGTSQGLSRFLPEPERQSLPPPVLLTGLRITGAAQNGSSIGETELHLTDLSANRRELQIAVGALVVHRPHLAGCRGHGLFTLSLSRRASPRSCQHAHPHRHGFAR